MSTSADNEKNDFALIPKGPNALEKAEPGPKRILTNIVTDTLAIVRNGPTMRQSRPRVVLVDDAPEMLDLMACFLKDWLEFDVLSFQDGDLAWQELLREAPDLLITNLTNLCRFKGLNGFDMVSRLAEKKVKFPVLVYDALMDKPGEEQVLTLAGPSLKVTCLYVPFTVDQLYKVLSTYLGQSTVQS